MNMEGIRTALITAMDFNWGLTHPNIQVLYENTIPVNLDALGGAFIGCEIEFTAATQVSLEFSPTYRISGYMVLTAFLKEGHGTKQIYEHLDYLFSIFQHKNFAGVHTGTPTFGRTGQHNNFYFVELRVPFWADSNA